MNADCGGQCYNSHLSKLIRKSRKGSIIFKKVVKYRSLLVEY